MYNNLIEAIQQQYGMDRQQAERFSKRIDNELKWEIIRAYESEKEEM